MRAAAILASVLSFFAGMWVLRQYQKHVPPFEQDPEWSFVRDPGNEVTATFMDGSMHSYTLRGHLVEDDDGVQPPDPWLDSVTGRPVFFAPSEETQP